MGLALTKTEKLLTWLGMWGAMRRFCPLVVTVLLSVALLESLTPPITRLFPSVPVNLIHIFAVGSGLLLGLIGFFSRDWWDLLFEMFYGAKGRWLETAHKPLLVFPAGAALKRHRHQAAQALSRRPDTEEGVYREAVKIARRQAERWEGIEYPLILSRFLWSVLWPCAFVGILALCGAVIGSLMGATTEAPRFLATAGGCLGAALLCVVPYSHLRLTHMIRLYQDVAGHGARKKVERH